MTKTKTMMMTTLKSTGKNKEGVYLIDKPAGWTSHDVVNVVRKWSEIRRVGHTGTLDPFATGLLIILVGKEFTKKQSEFLKLDKEYQMTITLGSESTTFDPEGVIKKISDKKPSQKEVENAIKNFEGEILQKVPAFSAVKIKGVPAYKKARKGEKFETPTKKVKVYSLELVSYKYPKVKLRAKVSSGTYIRSLASDIGDNLRTGAYLISLRRIKIGGFDITSGGKKFMIG